MSHDAGNDDKIANGVIESQQVAMDRLVELQSDLYGTGSTVGDVVPMPPAQNFATAASAGEMIDLKPEPFKGL
jgi:hypothetical protein